MNGFGRKNSAAVLAASLFTGAAVGALVTSALLAAASFVFVKLGSAPSSSASVIAAVFGAFGAFASGWFAVKLFGSRGMLLGSLAGLLLFVCVLATGVNGLSDALMRCAVYAVCGAVGGVARVNKRVKVKRAGR